MSNTTTPVGEDPRFQSWAQEVVEFATTKLYDKLGDESRKFDVIVDVHIVASSG